MTIEKQVQQVILRMMAQMPNASFKYNIAKSVLTIDNTIENLDFDEILEIVNDIIIGFDDIVLTKTKDNETIDLLDFIDRYNFCRALTIEIIR